MEVNDLKVYKCPFPKIRLGKENDGGYVIAEIPNPDYSVLLSAGIGNDCSFEEDFLEKFPNTKCYAHDGTIDLAEMQIKNPNITFINKNIHFINDAKHTNLTDIIDKNENIFLKMDIEGYEKIWLKMLREDQIAKFSQIVMEFHNPFEEFEKDIFQKINTNHYLVHFHPNNACRLRMYKNVIFPEVFECTYLNKKYFSVSPQLNTDSIPSHIDMKNVLDNDEIYITHKPFVN